MPEYILLKAHKISPKLSKVLCVLFSLVLGTMGLAGCSDDTPSIKTSPDKPQTVINIIDCAPPEDEEEQGTTTGVTGNTEENAKKVFDVMSAVGLDKTNIAGILGNWTMESGIDPTGVEGIYNEPFQLGTRKTSAMNDHQNYTLGTLFPMYAGSGLNINRSAYIGSDGQYWPGIGLGGFTGPACTDLLDYAKASGFEWYTMECQLGFVTQSGSGAYWRNPWLLSWGAESSASSAAATFLAKWEGCPGVRLEQRAQYAEEWYSKIQSWTPDTSYAQKVLKSAGTKISTSSASGAPSTTRCDCEDEEKDGADGSLDPKQFGTGHSIDIPRAVGSCQSPASVTVVKPPPDYGWLLSGDNFAAALQPCKSVFEKWKENGGKWADGLAGIANTPIVAVPERVVREAVGESVFNGSWGGVGVGAVIEIFYDDGHSTVVIAGDTKCPSDSTAFYYNGEHWGHVLGSGCSLIEPWQSQDDYYAGKRCGSAGYHSDMAGTMTKWVVYEKKIQAMDMSSLKVSKGKSGSSGGSSSSSSSGSSDSVKAADPSTFVNEIESVFQHGDLPKDKVKYIMMHDTQSSTDNMATIIQSWRNGAAGNGGVAAHFMVDRSGKISQCVPMNQIAHHAGGAGAHSNEEFGITQERDEKTQQDGYPDYAMNAWSIGIEIVHDAGQDYPEAQLDALDSLVAYIDNELGHKPEIIDHKEWTGASGVARKDGGQGKTDCDSDFPLNSYKNERHHDGFGGQDDSSSSGTMYDCPDNDDWDKEGAEGAVAWAIKVANSRTVGYSQGASRESVKNFDGKTMLNADCTAFVWYAWMVGGKNARVEAVSPNYGPWTGGFWSYYPKAGFVEHDFNPSELKPGDVLWTDGHAALYIGDGRIAEASIAENGTIYGEAGDQNQSSPEGVEDLGIGEVHINYLYTFTKYWRYTG